MLRKVLKLALAASLVAVVTGFGWFVYNGINTSEAAHFDTSINIVHNESGKIGAAFGETGNFVETEVAKIADISALISEWTPRYDRAQSAFMRFDASIDAVEERAEAYFASQRALTDGYHDPERKTQAQAEDEADYTVYTQWLDRAYSVRARAREITHRLEDMNTDLRKLELSSEFSFDSGRFEAVPSEILALDDELAQFKTASVNIRAITDSPFETK